MGFSVALKTPPMIPASLTLRLFVRWTGSNTNPGNNDGQGLAGTDRSNVILLEKQKYPEGNFRGAGTKYGHFGNNYPQRVDKVTWLGLSRQDLDSLALLLPGRFTSFST